VSLEEAKNITSSVVKSLLESLASVESLEDDGTLEAVINPSSCSKIYVHRWYYLKESYSPWLINKLVSKRIINEPKLSLLDPFCGAGSSLLGAQWENITSIGVDINPFFVFVSKVKSNWYLYDPSKVKEFYNKIKDLNTNAKAEISPPLLSSFRRLYDPKTLNELLLIKEKILEVKDELYRNLYLLALSAILEPASLAKKDGKGLKIVRTKPLASAKELFLAKLEEIIEDLIKLKSLLTPHGKARVDVYCEDSRELKSVADESVDAVVFSPPYLNTFDYTEVYKLELWFLDFIRNYFEFRKLRERTLRSHNLVQWKETRYWHSEELDKIVNYIRRKKLWSDIIPIMIRGYFDDMYLTFKQLYRVMKEGTVAIVVGNSAYAGLVIPVDLLLLKMAQDVGFKPKKLIQIRFLGTSSQQLRIIKELGLRNLLRESVITFVK